MLRPDDDPALDSDRHIAGDEILDSAADGPGHSDIAARDAPAKRIRLPVVELTERDANTAQPIGGQSTIEERITHAKLGNDSAETILADRVCATKVRLPLVRSDLYSKIAAEID